MNVLVYQGFFSGEGRSLIKFDFAVLSNKLKKNTYDSLVRFQMRGKKRSAEKANKNKTWKGTFLFFAISPINTKFVPGIYEMDKRSIHSFYFTLTQPLNVSTGRLLKTVWKLI